MPVIPAEWFDAARERIAPYCAKTPLTHDPERGLFLKWENHQVTGSFKARGALNKVLSLRDWERKQGLVAASAGNHGQGVALAAQLTGCTAEVFVSQHAVQSKVDAIRNLGAELHFVEGGYGEAELAAKAYASAKGSTFISPYNDGQIVAGQGTIALEVIEQMAEDFHTSPDEAAAWVLPVSGGGLICGCGAALATRGWRATLYGIQPAASAFTHSLFHHGTQEGVPDRPTLADGLSGAIDEDSMTIPMLREFVKDVLLVSEEEIERAIVFAWHTYGERLEGSAAAAVAAILNGGVAVRPCVVVLSGGNIERDVFDDILARHRVQARP